VRLLACLLKNKKKKAGRGTSLFSTIPIAPTTTTTTTTTTN